MSSPDLSQPPSADNMQIPQTGQENMHLASNRSSALSSLFWEILQTLLLAIILYFLVDTFVGRVRVENISMQPTLYEGQFILVNKFAYQMSDLQHGDIIIFRHDVTEDYIKRVIGLPGDTVEVIGGQVYVNGTMLIEPYIAEPPWYTGSWKVPEGQFFVLGDNRNKSSDSREWGYVPGNTIVGKAVIVYWPLNAVKILGQVP